MNSAFAKDTGLAGLSDNFTSPSKELADELVRRKKSNQTFYGKLVQIINVYYGARKNELKVRRIKPYLNHFSGGKPSTDTVLNDLIKRFPTMFGQPANTPAESPAGNSTQQSSAAAQPKQSSSKWLIGGLTLAGIGAAAWYFMPDENEKNN